MLWLPAIDTFLGIELREMLADDLVRRVSLDPFRSRIPANHSTFRIEHEDRIITGSVHQQTKSLFTTAKSRLRLLALGDIPHHGQDRVFAASLNRAEHDVNRKLGPVFPQAVKFKACSHG